MKKKYYKVIFIYEFGSQFLTNQSKKILIKYSLIKLKIHVQIFFNQKHNFLHNNLKHFKMKTSLVPFNVIDYKFLFLS